MAQMRLTLIGLYNYDPALFDQMVMPDGVNTDLVKNTILQKSGEFELIYTNLDYMKNMIGFWSNKHLRTFTKWNEALNIEYDPLYNYDRMEEITIGRKGSDSRSENASSTSTASDSTSNNSTSTTGTTEADAKSGNTKSETKGSTSPAQTTTTKTNTVAAYDSSTYQPKEQTTESLVLNTAGSDSTDSEGSYNEVNNRQADETNSRSENGVSQRSENSSANKNEVNQRTEDETHTAHLYGNIGVTTSQQMLQSELDIARFNLYEQIADLFVEEFCIMIY